MIVTSLPEAYRTLPAAFYRNVEPAYVREANIFAYNDALASDLALPETWQNMPQALSVLSGQETLSGDPAIALAYSGHQFGHWAGTLGDGRARFAGEVTAQDGLLYELHLKGAGQTPFSRRGDGKATLGSAMREYIVSEAMAALGVPTMRSLAIVTTGEEIQRNGAEPAAIVCRAGRSHIRVGTFQYAASLQDEAALRALTDFAMARLYPNEPLQQDNPYIAFFRAVVKRQALLVAKWMSIGFIHGVMNTDNMCVSGETIDYGPCAFMDTFYPAKVFSSIDRRGRYAWNKQPEMANWNLARLAESLLPLFGADEDEQVKIAEQELGAFAGLFQSAFNRLFARKLGIAEDAPGLSAFIGELFQVMTDSSVDFTQFFTALTAYASGEIEGAVLSQVSENRPEWLVQWKNITGFDGKLPEDRLADMHAANPFIIPRNHTIEAVIQSAYRHDYKPFKAFMNAVCSPYESRLANGAYEAGPQPEEIVEQTFCGT